MHLSGQHYAPSRFTHGERAPGMLGGYMGPRAGLDVVVRKKKLPALSYPAQYIHVL